MSLALDPQTEQRIHEETLRGHYNEPSELINRALDLLNDSNDSWTEDEKRELQESLASSRAQAARGEVVSGKALREDYERRRIARAG